MCALRCVETRVLTTQYLRPELVLYCRRISCKQEGAKSILRDLFEWGLNREPVELGIMDGLPGRASIFQRFFSRAQTQRCQKHAKANDCRRVRKQERELL